MNDKDLIIFDTTLRDGEQSPGASMDIDEKMQIAIALEELNVDIIEAGFPIASLGDFKAVQEISKVVTGSGICALARALDKDITTAAESLKDARSPRIHTFIATSPIHMEKKLKMSPEKVLLTAVKAIELAKTFTDDVEFSPEDAGRSELKYLCEVIEAAIDAGAKTINIPDTVGYNLPHQFGDLLKNIISNVSNSNKAIFSVHCHNDLGLAVGNSLSAVLNGARQIECTINGLGERAGNAALEEIVMTVKTRQDVFNCNTKINTKKILKCSRLVSSITGFPVQPNKAIVGKNAFAHESGIHQDGIIKSRETYEIMKADDVGLASNSLVLGKHSGRNAFKQKLIDLNIMPKDNSDFDDLFYKFKILADKKHEIFDEDLINLSSNIKVSANLINFNYMNVITETNKKPHAHIKLEIDGVLKEAKSTGDGAVDAAYNAIEKIIKSNCKLTLYSVNNITSGTDAQGEVTVRITRDNSVFNGHGADTDIVKASVLALVNALNKFKENPMVDSSKKRGI
ncbi:MAG: 2-isopropylmalate synthase [Gammaproteobacteria bacterium]|jgi:2-isopropylmalate synthase|nr:2-isopropylmalate synthase [Gammaproteobacteria bacterium]MBT4462777.1 2-isopropylmalate synthase [Gammaproteobacteria bacterium]MBT4654347.1 2-isopropylmalate synthase [Gammaproteobacteria bacterium]MBT5117333.1 2-isopropylmalate synthase [Gammaproteobacteria bacterium]MBT5761904.1 2-isopropylmalate synthase [Gammaproteobacteria bacterium]